MIRSQNSAPASAGRALLVFVQQLAHLVDRERRVLSVERLLTLALIQKRPVTSHTRERQPFCRIEVRREHRGQSDLRRQTVEFVNCLL